MKEKEITKTELAQRMDRDAKAFYERYTAGIRVGDDDRLLMTSFAVWYHHEYLVPVTAREARLVEALETIRRGDDLENIGTPVCNCGMRADHIADAITVALAEHRGEK